METMIFVFKVGAGIRVTIFDNSLQGALQRLREMGFCVGLLEEYKYIDDLRAPNALD